MEDCVWFGMWSGSGEEKMVERKMKEKVGRASVEKVLSCFGVRVDKRTVSDDIIPVFLLFFRATT